VPARTRAPRLTCIADVVRDFVQSLEDCNVFCKTADTYVLPWEFAPQVAPAIIDAICSVPDNKTGRRARNQGYGIERVPEQVRRAAAVGNLTISLANTIPRDDWQSMDVGAVLPQILITTPDRTDVACIEEGRYFPMDSSRQAEFQAMVAAVNGGISWYVCAARPPARPPAHLLTRHPPPRFAHNVIPSQDDKAAQKWVCKFAVAMMHKYCPNFTCLVGTQYLQRIAVHRAQDFPASDPRPRAYFPTDEYRNLINDDENLIVGQFIYANGCTLFSNITKIVV